MNEFVSWLVDTGYEKMDPILGHQVWKNGEKGKIVVWHPEEGLKSMYDMRDHKTEDDVLVQIVHSLKKSTVPVFVK
jgi:hypothetical protein